MEISDIIILGLMACNIGLIMFNKSVKKDLNEQLQREKSAHKFNLEKTIEHVGELNNRIDGLEKLITELKNTLESLTEKLKK